MPTKKQEKQDFGKAYEELEDIVEWFEREEIDLDEGIKKFERGLELARACKARLSQVENKVKEIKGRFGELDGGTEGEE